MAQTLAERLQALHRAHDLLLESQWSGASLKAMVERELDPYRREGGPKIMIKGTDVLLPPQCTSILAMTLHELATNAVKYGALSSEFAASSPSAGRPRAAIACCSPGRSGPRSIGFRRGAAAASACS